MPKIGHNRKIVGVNREPPKISELVFKQILDISYIKKLILRSKFKAICPFLTAKLVEKEQKFQFLTDSYSFI